MTEIVCQQNPIAYAMAYIHYIAEHQWAMHILEDFTQGQHTSHVVVK